MKLNQEVYLTLPDSIKNLVQILIKKLSPVKIVLFGSRARGDNRENSDFDIALEFPKKFDGEFTKIKIALEIEPLTLFKVDLLDLNELTQDYKKNVSKEGRLIYG